MEVLQMLGIAGLIALLLIAAAVAAVMVAKAQSRHYFACPNCGKEFRPRWTQLVFEVHAFEQHRMKCPYCHRTDFCRDLGRLE